MDPLSMHVANSRLPPLPGPAVDAAKDGPTPQSPAVGQVQTGLGALANREIAVGPGADRNRAQTGRSIIGSILSALSQAIQAIVLSPLMLVRKLGSYVLRVVTPAPPPAPGPGVAFFHQEVVRLTGSLATGAPLQQPPSVPRGLHESAIKDWLRDGVTINGNVYGGEGGEGALDMEIAARLLTRMCGDNPAMAEWVSRFANQQMGMPLMAVLMQEPLGPDGTPGFQFIGGSLAHSISALADGSIQVDVVYQWTPSKSPSLYLYPEVPFPVDERSSLTARCSIRLEAAANGSTLDMPVASILHPLNISSNVIHMQR